MKIGITERGDAGIDFNWVTPVEKKQVNGAILITKNITNQFIDEVIRLHELGNKLIVHCTCTGFGGTNLEPNVPNYQTQLNQLETLILKGFPVANVVLRIDPIFPTDTGLRAVDNVLSYSKHLNIPRIRISIVDEYNHVKDRYIAMGWTPLYGKNFNASDEQMLFVANHLSTNYPELDFQTCGENKFQGVAQKNGYTKIKQSGCISPKDIAIMGLTIDANTPVNPQNRNGCNCLCCKTELLTQRKQCPHNCVYCFWKQ